MDSNEEKFKGEFKEKLIVIGQPFNMFDRAISTGPKTIMDTAQLKDIGPLTAVATSHIAENAHGPSAMSVFLEIDTEPIKPRQTPYESVTGAPGENLILWAVETNSHTWVSLARVENEQDVRRIIFDQWHDVTGKASREIKAIVDQRQAQPLIIAKKDLQSASFRFGHQSEIVLPNLT